jgi:hypothetical protein
LTDNIHHLPGIDETRYVRGNPSQNTVSSLLALSLTLNFSKINNKSLIFCLSSSVLSFSVITDDLTLSSKDQNVFCIVNCKEDYDHLKLAGKPIFQKINTLYEKVSIEVSTVITEKDNTTKFEILLTFDLSPEISIFILSISGFT